MANTARLSPHDSARLPTELSHLIFNGLLPNTTFDDSDLNEHNHNPTGRNQYQDCPSKDDEYVLELLCQYHDITTNASKVEKLLKNEHGIVMSATTVWRRWTMMHLHGSLKMDSELPYSTKKQLVVDQMGNDPTRRKGARKIKEQIAIDTGYHIKRDFIEDIMRKMDPEGFELRSSKSERLKRRPLTSRGPHEEWSGDGHDKLVAYGFAIWGLRDKFSGYWLGLWVVPNNRLGIVVAYLWLSVIRDLKGMPVQQTTDCGSETTVVYGLANALRSVFAPELNDGTRPAHRFLKSVHNIRIERGWLDLREDWGHNIPVFFDAGQSLYDQNNPIHALLVKWLWPQLIQKSLDELREKMNNHRQRKDKKKVLPSGVSPRMAYSLWEEYGGQEWCLKPVDPAVIQDIMDELSGGLGDDLLTDYGIPPEFSLRASQVYESLNVYDLTLQNVWFVFEAMLPYFNNE